MFLTFNSSLRCCFTLAESFESSCKGSMPYRRNCSQTIFALPFPPINSAKLLYGIVNIDCNGGGDVLVVDKVGVFDIVENNRL